MGAHAHTHTVALVSGMHHQRANLCFADAASLPLPAPLQGPYPSRAWGAHDSGELLSRRIQSNSIRPGSGRISAGCSPGITEMCERTTAEASDG
jgi:hypothetical protein